MQDMAFLDLVEDMTIQEIKAQFETNLFGVVRVSQQVLPIMRTGEQRWHNSKHKFSRRGNECSFFISIQ